jgi:hypothetical protein
VGSGIFFESFLSLSTQYRMEKVSVHDELFQEVKLFRVKCRLPNHAWLAVPRPPELRGRENEIDSIFRAMEIFFCNQSAVNCMHIFGAEGVGKSALLSTISDHSLFRSFSTGRPDMFFVRGSAYPSRSGSLWAQLLCACVGICSQCENPLLLRPGPICFDSLLEEGRLQTEDVDLLRSIVGGSSGSSAKLESSGRVVEGFSRRQSYEVELTAQRVAVWSSF